MSDADIARQFLVEDHRAAGVPVLERKWYYTIEVAPGVFTTGCEFPNLALTRAALQRIDVGGLDCLDIGTMEGLVSILLSRRGARRIVAYDRLDLHERVEWLRSKLDVRFDYICGLPLAGLAPRLAGNDLFDVVILSGVLYHMFEPFAGLLTARSFLRNGGLMLVETAAVVSDEMCNYFNAEGRWYEGDNFWLPSLPCLDYLLRFARLKPLDCYYLLATGTPTESGTSTRAWHGLWERYGPKTERPKRALLIRICVPCLAVEEVVAPPEDRWIRLSQEKDFQEHLDWAKVARAARQPLSYPDTHSGQHPLVYRDRSAVDLLETVKVQPPFTVDRPHDQLRLRLGAQY